MLAAPARLLLSRCCVSALPADKVRCSERRLEATCFPPMAALSPEEESPVGRMVADPVSLCEWQAWGSSSTIPSLVVDVIDDLRDLERDLDACMNFGGHGGKLRVSISSCFIFPSSLVFGFVLSILFSLFFGFGLFDLMEFDAGFG